MSWGAIAVGVGGAVIGGMTQANAAEDASAAQQQSTREANALQLAMYNNNVQLSAPAINTGNAARDRLSFLMGLSGRGYSNSRLPTAAMPGMMGAAPGGMMSTDPNQPATYDQLRAQLLPQFTRTAGGGGGAGGLAFDPNTLPLIEQWNYARMTDPAERAQFEAAHLGQPTSVRDPSGNSQSDVLQWAQPGQGGGSTIDEAALDAAIRARLQAQADAEAQREAAARADPAFGSLAQGFEFERYTPDTSYQANTFTPDKFSYTGEDLYNDPSYKFRLQQGQKALDRQGLAAGRFLSGGQLQASSNYNQDAASQEFQNAYARAQNTFRTNETGRFNAFNVNETGRYNAFNLNETNRFNAFNTNEANRFNAYQTGYQNTVNPLLALSGAGQLSGGQLMQANTRTADAMGANLIGFGNAAAAGAIGQANGINNAIGGSINSYQTNSLLNRFGQGNGGFGGAVNNNPAAWSPSMQIDQLGAQNNWWN